MNMHVAICMNMNAIDISKKTPFSEIYKAVYEVFGFSESSLKVKRRTVELVEARHAFAYYARKVLNFSFPDIANELQQDHTTIIHGNNTFDHRLKTNYNNIAEKYSKMCLLLKKSACIGDIQSITTYLQ